MQAIDIKRRESGNILDAHKQWASRPADEAVFSFEELLSRTRAVKLAAREANNVAWDTLRVEAKGGDLLLGGRNGAASMTNYAFGPLCALPGADGTLAPAGFVGKLPAQLAADVLNERLRGGIGRDSAAQLLLHKNGGYYVRAITTESYERVWDHDLVQRLQPLCERGTWGPAQAFRRAGTDVPARELNVTERPLPLGWVGDRSMFVALVDYEGSIEVEGSQYARFFLLSNSEVGAASLKITFGLMDFACCNFILWGCRDVVEVSLKHTKNVHSRLAAVGRQLPALSSGEQHDIREGIYAARKCLIADTQAEVIAKVRAVTDLPANLCEDAFARVERTPRYGDARSVWGMVNGLTEASQSVTENADKRTAIDLKAARLMGLLK